MVNYFIGKRSYFSYALETAYGAGNAATNYSWLGIVQSNSPTSKSEIIQVNSMDYDDTRNVSDYFETLRNYGGSVEFLVQHCRPLMLAIGSDTKAGTDPYTHTLTEANELPSFVANFGYHHDSADHAVDYTGCVVNRINLECAKGEFLKCTLEFIGQKGTDHAFRSYQTGAGLKKYPLTGSNPIIPYAYSDAAVTINGTPYTPDSIKMSVNNNLLSEPVLDSGNDKRIAEPIPQICEFEASMTIKMATDDLYDLWETGAYIGTDPVITFERSTNDKVVFTLEDAILESAISPYNISDGIVLIELPFKVKKIGIIETNSMNVDYSTAEI